MADKSRDRIRLGDPRDRFTDPGAALQKKQPITIDDLPPTDAILRNGDPLGPPDSIGNGRGASGADSITLMWDIPASALYRTFKVYEGTEKDFSIEGLEPILTTNQTIITIHRPPGSGPFWYAVMAVNSRGETSELVYLGGEDGFSLVSSSLPSYAELKAQILAAGGLDLGEAGVVTGKLAAAHMAVEDISIGMGQVTGTLLVSRLVTGGDPEDPSTWAYLPYAIIPELNTTNCKFGTLDGDVANITNVHAGNIKAEGAIEGVTLIGVEVFGATYFGELIDANGSARNGLVIEKPVHSGVGTPPSGFRLQLADDAGSLTKELLVRAVVGPNPYETFTEVRCIDENGNKAPIQAHFGGHPNSKMFLPTHGSSDLVEAWFDNSGKKFKIFDGTNTHTFSPDP